MKVQNQKTSNYKDGIQNENFTKKNRKLPILQGKVLLTLKSIG